MLVTVGPVATSGPLLLLPLPSCPPRAPSSAFGGLPSPSQLPPGTRLVNDAAVGPCESSLGLEAFLFLLLSLAFAAANLALHAGTRTSEGIYEAG